MVKIILILLFTLGFLYHGPNAKNPAKCFQQNQQYFRDSIEYIQKAIAFIKQVEKKDLADSSFLLISDPVDPNDYECTKYLIQDTQFFSKEEIAIIKEKKYPSISSWTNKDFPVIRIISSDSLGHIFKSGTDGWTYFRDYIGSHGYNKFSVPIFLRNYTYCLFYTSNNCGWLCGGGGMELYKNDNGKWYAINFYCHWVS